MEYNLRTENVTLTDLERTDIDKKISRLHHHLHIPYTIDISIRHDSHHLNGDVVTCRINIEQGKKVLHAERSSETIADALDATIHALKKELEREHDRRKDRHEE